MTDNIRQFIDPEAMAEPKKITEGKLRAYQNGYEKGYRNGALSVIGVAVGFLIIFQLGRCVL